MDKKHTIQLNNITKGLTPKGKRIAKRLKAIQDNQSQLNSLLEQFELISKGKEEIEKRWQDIQDAGNAELIELILAGELCRLEQRQAKLKSRLAIRWAKKILPYVLAMTGASGLSENEAKLCVYYALASHFNFENIPILAFIGATGTGKSEAMKQLFPMVKGKWIAAKTTAGLREDLKDVRVAFIDESDKVDEELLTLRFNKETGMVKTNKPQGAGWQEVRENIFGATVLARRTPIADVALRSRCLIIKTKPKEGNYKRTPDKDLPDSGDLSKAVNWLKKQMNIEQASSGRVNQTWNLLLEVAKYDPDWLSWANEQIRLEQSNLKGGQGYEPQEAVLKALDALARNAFGKRDTKSVRISDIKRFLWDEYELKMKGNQIMEMLGDLGFETKPISGYDSVIPNLALLPMDT